jgi:hypothetical protein
MSGRPSAVHVYSLGAATCRDYLIFGWRHTSFPTKMRFLPDHAKRCVHSLRMTLSSFSYAAQQQEFWYVQHSLICIMIPTTYETNMLLTRLLCVDVTNKPIRCGLHDSCERKYAKQVSSSCNIRKRLQSLPLYAETLLVRTHVHMLFANCYSEKQNYKRAIIGYVCSMKRYTLRMGE